MDEHAVVIAGGGPTGLMLAAELTLAGVEVAVIERRGDSTLIGSRAGGIHARTIELLDQRGVADRFLAQGQTAQAAMLGGTVMDISDFPTRHLYALGIFQNKIEALLAEWVTELGVQVRYGQEVVGFAQDVDGVDVELADGGVLRARYLVAADGGRSVVRKLAGIDFPGWEATRSTLIAEVQVTAETPAGVLHDAAGAHGIQVLADDAPYVRVVTSELELAGEADPTLADLSASLIAAYGQDFGVHDPRWLSRFTDATRQAASYRSGRVLIAGDAAHIHYPAGGQGLSLGIHDAVNLGWKLGQVIRGESGQELLDSYEAERHPATARTLQYTMALALLQRGDGRMKAVLGLVGDLASFDDVRVYAGARTAGLDIHYDLGGGHPLLGRRMPDLDLGQGGGSSLGTPDSVFRPTPQVGEPKPTSVYTFLHTARPLLLNLGAPGRFARLALPPRVQLVDATYDGAWELPVLGTVPAPSAVLVRPDGYVAWVGQEEDTAGLEEALIRWFGRATG